jgi:hypothetical protein
MRKITVLALFLLSAPQAWGQIRTGSLKVILVNGTTGEPGEAEEVTLFKQSAGVEPIAGSSHVQGSFLLENIQLDGDDPYLLQVTSAGVTYNQPVSFGPGNEAEASLRVYDVTQDRSCLEVKSARYLLRRNNSLLRVEKLYVVENRCEPRKTFYDSGGTFRFHLPREVAHGSSVLVSAPGGAPVTVAASPLPDGSGYVTKTPFNPGKTDVIIAYDIALPSGNYQLREQAYYALSQILVLITPSDVELKADGWENLTPEGTSRFIVLRQSNVEAGSLIDVTLAGGAEPTAAPVATAPTNPSLHGTVTQLPPDPSRAQMWLIVLVMAAALGYGLLNASLPKSPSPEAVEK